ncbi:MAG TPA: MFS transporter, partial [Alphaproteobacteria bacterium]|nr:MFS transporter [Alphaproteobacteria bacterium]
MSVWKPLAHPPLALLWASQTLSAVGDEFYAVALVWMAVGLIGHDAAYLTAVQAATMLAVSLFGGVLAERWDLRRTMIGADLARAAVVLAVPVAVWAGGASLPLLLGTVIAVSALSALFDPALQASVPRLVTDP